MLSAVPGRRPHPRRAPSGHPVGTEVVCCHYTQRSLYLGWSSQTAPPPGQAQPGSTAAPSGHHVPRGFGEAVGKAQQPTAGTCSSIEMTNQLDYPV